jgi:hypothetical protein
MVVERPLKQNSHQPTTGEKKLACVAWGESAKLLLSVEVAGNRSLLPHQPSIMNRYLCGMLAGFELIANDWMD